MPPRDPRYVNPPAQQLQISTPERIYTLDGEVLHTTGSPLHVASPAF